jgi:two-component sensor histidine kinase
LSSPRWLRGTYSIRTHLIAFGLATLLPVTILAGVLLFRSANLERDQLEARLVQVAGDIAKDLDRDLDRHFTLLKTLATLPSLANGNWQEFHTQASAALQDRASILLIDRDLRQLVNTYVPFGRQPPFSGDPQTALRVIETKEAGVSDMFYGLASKTWVFNINLPILRNGEVQYILHLSQLAANLLPIAQNTNLPPEWTVVLLDRKGQVLTRSADNARWMGAKPDTFATDAAGVNQGLRKTFNLEGAPVLRAVAQSELSGWLVTVSVPLPMAEEPLQKSAANWAFITIIALILTAVSAWMFARALAVPLAAATDAAAALGRGELLENADSSVKEANAIMDALRRAGVELTARAEHQRLLLNELSHRAKNLLAVVQALVMRSLSADRSTAEGRSVLLERLHVLSRAHELQMSTDWNGAPIRDIIAAELAAFTQRVRCDGPDLTIHGEMVQTFGLILHELVTNAAKYGALSNETGSVAVTWSTSGSDPNARFRFRWQETGGPPVSPPAHKGFGSMLFNGVGSSDAANKPRTVFEPDGFVYEFEVWLKTFVRKAAQRPGS